MSTNRSEHAYLELLSRQYPTVEAVCSEIIQLGATLSLPKGTEHFMSDLHGEDEAFRHILNNCSGVVREKVDAAFGHTVPERERAWFAAMIYYPEEKIEEVKKSGADMTDWYSITLYRLTETARLVASKYTRSRVRAALPEGYADVLDELLYTSLEEKDKAAYVQNIVTTIVETDCADEVIGALCALIKRLAVDRLHIVGDVFDRGPRADRILDLLMRHHCVDVQWGNHDILWMGAAAGNEACIACVLNLALQYNTLDIVENGYGISLRDMIAFAQETYRDCTWFMPRTPDDKEYLKTSMDTLSKVHKAVAIMQFKLEGQLILRHPEYGMEDRLLLDKIDTVRKTVTIDGVDYALNDAHFPTVDPENPFELTLAERELMASLRHTFRHSARLQQQVAFLYNKGGMYTIYNRNLLYHGCIPLDEEGQFLAFAPEGRELRGRAYMDACDDMARRAYFLPKGHPDKQRCMDFLWYLWCGRRSPLFGREKITTFERYFVSDRSVWEEKKNPYYRLLGDRAVCDRILSEFGLDPAFSHIINGHVPVRTLKGESPIKADGRLLVIDGGFCKAYHQTTGIAGYTLIYNSWGLRLISHKGFPGIRAVIQDNSDILTTKNIFETSKARILNRDTDEGRETLDRIAALKALLEAYRSGVLRPKK